MDTNPVVLVDYRSRNSTSYVIYYVHCTWLTESVNTVKPIYNGPVYSIHPAYYGHPTTWKKFQLPYIFCKVDLYNYSGHPVYNSHLAISQGWPLYTGLTVNG